MPALSPCAKPVEDDEEEEMGLMVAQAMQAAISRMSL
jgi:hypothetical protein